MGPKLHTIYVDDKPYAQLRAGDWLVDIKTTQISRQFPRSEVHSVESEIENKSLLQIQ